MGTPTPGLLRLTTAPVPAPVRGNTPHLRPHAGPVLPEEEVGFPRDPRRGNPTSDLSCEPPGVVSAPGGTFPRRGA